MEEGGETPVQQPVIDSQPGPMTQLLQDSQGQGGGVTEGDGGKDNDGREDEGMEVGRGKRGEWWGNWGWESGKGGRKGRRKVGRAKGKEEAEE